MWFVMADLENKSTVEVGMLKTPGMRGQSLDFNPRMAFDSLGYFKHVIEP